MANVYLNVYPYLQAYTYRKIGIGIFDDHDWCSLSSFIFVGYVNPAFVFNMMQCCNLPGLRKWEAISMQIKSIQKGVLSKHQHFVSDYIHVQ